MFTYSLSLIRSYTSNDNKVFFSSLKPIYTNHFYVFIYIRNKLSIFLQIINNITSLTFIWCNYTYLMGFHVTRQKFIDYSFNLHRFHSIEIGCSTSRNFFLALEIKEKYRLIFLRPFKIGQIGSI